MFGEGMGGGGQEVVGHTGPLRARLYVVDVDDHDDDVEEEELLVRAKGSAGPSGQGRRSGVGYNPGSGRRGLGARLRASTASIP